MNDVRDVLLMQLDHAWSHPWESVQSAMKGVSEETAAWQHASYANAEREANWPLPGTILWQLAHLAACKRYYAGAIRARPKEPNDPDYLPRATLSEALASLAEVHAALRTAIAELKDAELGEKVANGQTLAEFITMTIRHDAWHSSQIKMVQRLWPSREHAG